MKISAIVLVGCLLCGRARAQEIKFSDESANCGTAMKPRAQSTDPELTKGEFPAHDKTDAGFYAWPFDILFCDLNGDGHLDLFMTNHPHCAWSRLWLGDGKGKLTLVDPLKLLADGKSRGSFSLVACDFGGGRDLLITDGDVIASQFHYTGPAGKLAPEEFAWTKQPLHGAIYTYLLADFNGDGFLDAACGANRGAGGKVWFGKGQPFVKDFEPAGDTFVGFHSLCADMNGDGWPDILSSNFGETKAKVEFFGGLGINDGKGAFKECAVESGLEAMPAGGNIIAADFNNDGLMDIYVCGYPSTRKAEGAVKLYINSGDGKFRDATEGSGLEGPKSVWATRYVKSTAADFDNDGLVDIVNFASGGYRLYRNLGGGKFKDVTEAAGVPTANTGEPCAASGDYDEDGRVDLAVLSGGVWLGRNVTENSNGWLKVKLIGPGGNPDAAGASVTIYKAGQIGKKEAILGHQQAMFSTDYHTTGSLLHFGLGSESSCDVRAVYPGGKTVDVQGIKAKNTMTVRFQ